MAGFSKMAMEGQGGLMSFFGNGFLKIFACARARFQIQDSEIHKNLLNLSGKRKRKTVNLLNLNLEDRARARQRFTKTAMEAS